MTSIYDLKPRFQAALRPTCSALAGAGITANQVTAAALILSVAGGAAIAVWPGKSWPLLLMPLVLFIRMALNAIDGMLAREHNQQSAFGGFLNELSDVVSDTALYLPLALVPFVNGYAIVLLTLLAIISEFAGVVAVQVGASRRYDGPMGKSDRAFFFGLVCLLLGLKVTPGLWLDALLGTAVVLLAITTVNRVRNGLAEIN